MYLAIRAIHKLVVQAANPHTRSSVDLTRTRRFRDALDRLMEKVPEREVPPGLVDAIATGRVVGEDAALWVDPVREWLANQGRLARAPHSAPPFRKRS